MRVNEGVFLLKIFNSTLLWTARSSVFVLALPATTPVPLGTAAYPVEAWVNPNFMPLGSSIGWGNYGATNQANGLSLSPTGRINYLNGRLDGVRVHSWARCRLF